jgi:ABC-type lipoprotein release transport system permease subunit
MIRLARHAARMFARKLHRYRVVLAALSVVTAVLIVVLGSVLGMQETLRGKASRYFAGDVVVLGFAGDGRSLIETPQAALTAVEAARAEAEFPVRAVSRRSSYYEAGEISLFFAGYWTRQRRLVGVEWQRERPVLEELELAAGAVPEAGDGGGALISTAAAEELEIGVGDELLIAIRSRRGRQNTAEVTVRGIYRESSFFGYTTYIERTTLNRLKEVPEARINEIGVYLENPRRDERRAAAAIAAALSQRLPGFGVLETREGYQRAARVGRDGRHYGVVTLEAQLTEITDLLAAVTIIATTVIILFLGIVVVGVGNTYTMIVYERTREIGTLRALGLYRGRLVVLFLLEALILGLSGVILGSVAGIATLEAVRLGLDFSGRGWARLFLIDGRLEWTLPAAAVFATAGLAVGASVIGALRAAVRAGFIRPVDALSRE